MLFWLWLLYKCFWYFFSPSCSHFWSDLNKLCLFLFLTFQWGFSICLLVMYFFPPILYMFVEMWMLVWSSRVPRVRAHTREWVAREDPPASDRQRLLGFYHYDLPFYHWALTHLGDLFGPCYELALAKDNGGVSQPSGQVLGEALSSGLPNSPLLLEQFPGVSVALGRGIYCQVTHSEIDHHQFFSCKIMYPVLCA